MAIIPRAVYQQLPRTFPKIWKWNQDLPECAICLEGPKNRFTHWYYNNFVAHSSLHIPHNIPLFLNRTIHAGHYNGMPHSVHLGCLRQYFTSPAQIPNVLYPDLPSCPTCRVPLNPILPAACKSVGEAIADIPLASIIKRNVIKAANQGKVFSRYAINLTKDYASRASVALEATVRKIDDVFDATVRKIETVIPEKILVSTITGGVVASIATIGWGRLQASAPYEASAMGLIALNAIVYSVVSYRKDETSDRLKAIIGLFGALPILIAALGNVNLALTALAVGSTIVTAVLGEHLYRNYNRS